MQTVSKRYAATLSSTWSGETYPPNPPARPLQHDGFYGYFVLHFDQLAGQRGVSGEFRLGVLRFGGLDRVCQFVHLREVQSRPLLSPP